MKIPSLKEYTEKEFLEKIILPLIKEYAEICWFADDKVAITQEVGGAIQASSWTSILSQIKDNSGQGLIKIKTGKYIELERMLSSIIFFHLFYDGSEQAYQKFVSVQKNDQRLAKEILSFESFKKIHALARKVACNEACYQSVVSMLIWSDLGKTPKALSKAQSILKSIPPDHDDFIESVLSQEAELVSQVIPGFKQLASEIQILIKHVASAMKVHLGHVLHLEGGEGMFNKFNLAVKQGKVTPKVFDFAFLIQLCDVSASSAQLNNEGSLTLTENTYQGYQLVAQTLKVIQSQGTSSDALQFYLKARGEFLNINPNTPFNRVLIRIAAMLRIYSKEDAQILLKLGEGLAENAKNRLVEQFGIEAGKEQGINAWKRNPTYVPAVFINLARFNDKDEAQDLKIQRAVEGVVCVAEILQKYGQVMENRNAEHPLSLNALAGLANKQPKLFMIKTFNANHFTFNRFSVELVVAPEKTMEANPKIEKEGGQNTMIFTSAMGENGDKGSKNDDMAKEVSKENKESKKNASI